MVLVTPRLQLLGAEVVIDRAHGSHEVTVKLARWPACRNPMEVRGFLGTVGVVRKVKSLNQQENDMGLVSIHVDMSNIGVGWMIAQQLEDAEYPIVFGSITLNEQEGWYSQPKLELYEVFRALKVERHRLHNIHF